MGVAEFTASGYGAGCGLIPSNHESAGKTLSLNAPLLSPVEFSSLAEQRSIAASFEELAMPLFDSLYNFAHWLTQNHDEAEDLVQETYVKALKGFSSFQQGTNFHAWIFRILRNTFLTSRTGLQTTRTVALEEDAEDEIAAGNQTPESIAIDRNTQERVRAAIAALPLIYREVLLLCDLEEMSYQSTAETLSIPIGTVMSRLSRARKSLREALRASGQEARHG